MRLDVISRMVAIAILFPTTMAFGAPPYGYLDDSNPLPGSTLSNEDFPKVVLTETLGMKGSAERYSKYDVLGPKSSYMSLIKSIQSINPDVLFHYQISPRAYQGFLAKDTCDQGMGIPFGYTGPASQDCTMFAGHWLYKAGTTLQAAVNATSGTIYVNDKDRLVAGQFVVIYDAPAGSFKNAEHAKVSSVDKSSWPYKVTLTKRGFKSKAASHPKGAIVAQHVTGLIANPENWSYNMSLEAPMDANGNTMAEYMVDWLVNNYDRDANGRKINGVRVDGFYFDADAYYVNESADTDVDNDLVGDGGIAPNGVNLSGEGLEDFYSRLRMRFPGKNIVGGSRRTRGFDTLNGTQMEGWAVAGNYHSPNPEYEDGDGFDALLQRYTVHMRHHQTDLLYTENLSKTATKLYPRDNKGLTSNAAFRFAFASTLLDDGYYGEQNSTEHQDPWYDEYAVDTVPGSATYGRAIASNPTNESAIRSHKGWLGRPLDHRVRLYDSTKFAPSKTLISNGDFESGSAGWDSANVNISRDAGNSMEGAASLRVSKHKSYDDNISSTFVRSPGFPVKSGRRYTLAFSVKSSQMRDLRVQMPGRGATFLAPEQWTRVVIPFTANTTGTAKLKFYLGKENTQVWLDEVYLFEGDTNIFFREFENGAVVVNATRSQQTVDLGDTYLRIKGTGQDPINNGANVTSVTLPAYDAAILVRPDGAPSSGTGSGSGGSSTGGSNTSCGMPSYNSATDPGVFVWEDTCSPGTWHVRATAGGSAKKYIGSIVADSNLIAVSPYLMEKNDVLDVSNLKSLKFEMILALTKGEDGFEFKMPASGDVCLDIQSPSNTPVLLGQNAIPTSYPLNLRTQGPCNSATKLSYGQPKYDPAKQQATILWEDATTGKWHLRVTAGGSSKLLIFAGAISKGAVTSVQKVRMEPEDVLSLKSGNINYTLKVKGAGQDGFDFTIQPGTSPCLDLSQSPGQLLLGESMTPVSGPINLASLGSCTP